MTVYLYVIGNRFLRVPTSEWDSLERKNVLAANQIKFFSSSSSNATTSNTSTEIVTIQFHSKSWNKEKNCDINFSSMVNKSFSIMHRNVVNYRLLQIRMVSNDLLNFRLSASKYLLTIHWCFYTENYVLTGSIHACTVGVAK